MAVNVKDILSTMDTVLSNVKAMADIPGVNLIPYVSTISSAIGMIHSAYQAGIAVEPYIKKLQSTFSGDGVPSQAEMDELDAKIAELEAKVDAPLPQKEEGEPD